jgi:hypothetical protein
MSVAPLLAPLPTVPGGFPCIHADPPLRFQSNSRERPGRNAMRHYRCFEYSAFEALDVAAVAADDAFLFLWVPSAFLAVGKHLPLVKAWGLRDDGNGIRLVETQSSRRGPVHGAGADDAQELRVLHPRPPRPS